MIATQSFACRDSDGFAHTIEAGRTHIVRDHEIVMRYPEAFAPEPSDRTGGPELRTHVSPAARRQRMAEQFDAIQRGDRAREERRFERPETRERRLFEEETERLLASLAPPEDRDVDDLCDLSDLYARRAEDHLAALDEAHGPVAPWRR
jgi:hypothetical protein